jgi:hypothetical protein
MPFPEPSQRQILEEDLQIVRATLETISGDVRRISGRAADAIKDAVEKLKFAQHQFVRADGD